MIDFSDLAASRGVALAAAAGRLALLSGSALRPGLPHGSRRMRRFASVAAFIAITGCSSWFGGPEVQQPAQQAAQATATTAAAPAAATTDGAIPDVNSVPSAAPVPTGLDVQGVQPGLAADRTNAQYTDETLTAPAESAARPVAPAAPAAAPAEEVAATAPVGTPAPQVPAVSQQELPMAAPAAAGQYPAPQMTQLGGVSQGYVGTPQPGSKPLGGGGVAGGYVVQPGTVPQPSAPVVVDYSSIAAGGTYGYASYGAYQRNNPAQAYYRSPYGIAQPTAIVPAAIMPAAVVQPAYVAGFQPYAVPVAVPPLPAPGQPVGIVFFNNGSAKLSRDDARVVKQVAEMHRYYGGVIRLVGHASQRTGNMNAYAQDQVNFNVSMKRANAIARALSRQGVPAGLIQVAAAGATTPVAVETMPAGEASNRRVEIFLSAY